MIRIISSLLAFFSVASLFGQQVSEGTPKLVVGITIDQLRGDYLELFKRTFGENGFKRLLNEGLVYSGVAYDFPNIDQASATATVYTGAYPFYHGIVGEKKYSLEANREISSFTDANYNGTYTSERLSPLPVKVSTLPDELKIATNGKTSIVAFAPDASGALASGGHVASGAYWIEDYTGKWSSTTFYKTRQAFIDQYNRGNQSLTTKISGLSWRPALDVSRYTAFPYTQSATAFQHSFAASQKNNIRLFKQSPLVNAEIREMAEKMLNSGTFAKNAYPDFLALTFYAGNFENASDKNYSIEIQDTYYRLDQEIAKLLESIEKTVGLKNTLIFVVSTGYFNEQEVYPKDLTLPGGEFRPDRNQALLNMYLMAVYGKDQWIKKYYNNQLFFDRKLIEDKKISLNEFQTRAAEFLVLSSGIQDVITSQQMLHGAYNQTVQFYRNGFHKGISGDLFLEFQPGWEIITGQSSDNHKVRNNAVSAPVIFFGQNIQPQKINRTIQATEIAPSVAYRLRIRAPNAAKEAILKEMIE